MMTEQLLVNERDNYRKKNWNGTDTVETIRGFGF